MNLHAITLATLLVAILGPATLAMVGLLRHRKMPRARVPRPRWDWTLTLRSTLLYTFAFNLVFFVQELFLVVPKALTPGLRPTLYHNNHSWEGSHPLAHLFQGTGALATVVLALLCLWRVRRRAAATANAQLLLVWIAYCGLLMALPQVAIGALSGGSDLGMAMSYFGLASGTRLALGLLALAAIPPLALLLIRPLLALADRPERVAMPGARMRFVLQIATVPALAGAVLSIAFRVPREWIEVVLLPAWVAVLGVAWIQAGAWRIEGAGTGRVTRGALVGPLVAVLALLVVFQVVLRPGIPFY